MKQMECNISQTNEALAVLNVENGKLFERVSVLTKDLKDVRFELKNVSNIHYEDTVVFLK